MNAFTYTRNGIVFEDENLKRKADALAHSPLSFTFRYRTPEARSRWLKAIHKQLMFASMPAEFHAKKAQREALFVELYGNPTRSKDIPMDVRAAKDGEIRALDHWLLDTLVKYRQVWTPRERALVVVEEK